MDETPEIQSSNLRDVRGGGIVIGLVIGLRHHQHYSHSRPLRRSFRVFFLI